MTPRRLSRRQALLPRRTRRGIGTSTSTGSPMLTVAAAPAASYVNRAAGAGATIQLANAQGQPLAQAGVAVTVRVALGAAVSVSASPSATVSTDAAGKATFTGFTLTGLAGQYSLVFEATGYTGVSASTSVIAGAANAGQSVASVPGGTVATPTVIQITLRDQDGNVLTAAASGAVTVQVTGTNPVAQTTVPFVAGTGYRFTYTPSAAGTDSVLVKYGGTSVSGSPYTSAVTGTQPGFTANSLRYGLNQSRELLLYGPRYSGSFWTTQEPIYRVIHGVYTPSNIQAAIDDADTKNILLYVNMMGNKFSYWDVSLQNPATNPANWTSFKTKLDTWTASYMDADFRDAVSRRRIVVYGLDEPWISSVGNSMPPSTCREFFREYKLRWPDMILTARFEPNQINNGWGGEGGSVSGVVNYFDKLDYSFATYRGPDLGPWANTIKTPAAWVAYARPENDRLGYGTFYGQNWWNYNGKQPEECWDALDDDVSWGRIYGPDDAPALVGKYLPCAQTSTEKFWVGRPQIEIDYVNAILAHEANLPPTKVSPVFLNWPHCDPGLGNATIMKPFEIRADRIAAWVQVLNAANGRTTPFQWRTPK